MGPLSAPLDPRICVSRLEQLCALQPLVFDPLPRNTTVSWTPVGVPTAYCSKRTGCIRGATRRRRVFNARQSVRTRSPFCCGVLRGRVRRVCAGWPFPPVRPPQASTALNSSSYTSFLPHQYAAYGADAVRRQKLPPDAADATTPDTASVVGINAAVFY